MTVAQHTLPPGLQGDGGCRNKPSLTSNVCNTVIAGPSALVDGSMTTLFCVNGIENSVNESVTIDFALFRLANSNPLSIAQVELSLLTCPGSESTNVILYGQSHFNSDPNTLLVNVSGVLCNTAQNVSLFLKPPVEEQFFLLMFTTAAIKVAGVQFFDKTPSSSCPPPLLATPTTSPPPVLAMPSTSSPPVQATKSVLSPPTQVVQTSDPQMLSSTSMPSPSQSPVPSEHDTGLIVGVAIAAVVALIAITLAVFFICHLMSIRRKQKQSQVEKLQSAMLEHKSIELTEADQEEIHNHMYEQVALTPQPEQFDQQTEPPKSMDNPNYDNTQQKTRKVQQLSGVSNPVYSAIAATSANDDLKVEPPEPPKSMDNPNYDNTQQKADKVRQFSDISNPVYSAIAATSANGDPKVEPPEPPKSMDNPNYDNTQQKADKIQQVSDISSPVYSVIAELPANSDPKA